MTQFIIMTCYHPNFIVKKRLSPTAWLDYKIRDKYHKLNIGWKVQKDKPFIYQFVNGKKYKNWFLEKNEIFEDVEVMPVPCGCCVGCRLDYSKQWAARCYLESTYYEHNYFITLTYNDDNLPKGPLGNATLRKEDFTKFIKDLRRYYKYHYNIDNIRFFGCGEYGEKSFRPHLHILFFNLPIPDLSPEFHYVDDEGRDIITTHVENGNIYYWSESIHKIWNKGNIVIGSLTWESCSYTSRYITKKQKGKGSKEAYDDLGILPVFCQMSRKPGIAAKYFEDNENMFNELLYIPSDRGVKSLDPGRYFLKLLEKTNPDLYELVKEDRQLSGELSSISTYHNTNLQFSEYLSLLEERKEIQVKCLIRQL